MFRDETELRFKDLVDFEERLRETEAETNWIDIEINNLDVSKQFIPVTEAEIDTNENGTKLFVQDYESQTRTPIRTCALRTLYSNLGLGGELMKKLDLDDMEEYVCFGISKNRKHRPKLTFKVPVVDGKVNAFLSEGYANLPAPIIFEEAHKHFEDKINSAEFKFNGYWSYYQCAGEYFLPIKKVVAGQEYSVVLVVKTSDAGYSSVNLSAYLSDGRNKQLPIMSDISTIHKGNAASVERLKEMFNMADGAVDDGVKKLNKLLHIIIENPKNTMKRVAKEVGLPKKDSLTIIDSFEDEGFCTAFDCYVELSKILEDDTDTLSVRERNQGNLLKLLGITWERFDIPGEYAW